MIIGIDLGTTNSLAAYYDGKQARIIPNRLGEHLTPSVVSVDDDGTVLVGKTALARGLRHPLTAATVFKRSMGTDREYDLCGKKFRAEELSSFVLRSLKEDAETYLKCKVDEAVISVPAYFNDRQRKATKRAGELAGLRVERIVNEPTAAAVAHGLLDKKERSRYLIFDLGGGTFDVSILERTGLIIEVRSVAGDNFLGGENFTDIVEQLFCTRCGVDFSALTGEERAQLRERAEVCKKALSSSSSAVLECRVGKQTKSLRLTEKMFEEACEPLFERLMRPVERSLRDAGIRTSDISEIVLVGGATKAPVVRKLAARMFGRLPNVDVNPDEVVAVGAALQSAIKQRAAGIKEVILTDVCPFTLGTEVVSHNGYFEESGHFMPIIERNTVIPVSRTHTFYTAGDNQEAVRVEVLQGESRMAKNNLLLGELRVPVPPKPRGEESIDVTYTYDVNSLLEIIVKVNSTGFTKKMIIRGEDSALTEEQAQKRMEELSYLKISPREQEENKLTLYRADLAFEECTGDERMILERYIGAFEGALHSGKREDIERRREELSELLTSLGK